MSARILTPEELGRWSVVNMLPPEMERDGRAAGIARRVAAIVREERERSAADGATTVQECSA